MRAVFLTVFLVFVTAITVYPAEKEKEIAGSLNLFGEIRLESIYDNTLVEQGDWLLYVPPGPGENNDVFLMSIRHSRIGIKFDNLDLSTRFKIRGLIESDFAGGFPNSDVAVTEPNPRLRRAWFEIYRENWQLRSGQDWALNSGPFPSTTNYMLGAAMGNLWIMSPQIRFTHNLLLFKYSVSINRPVAGNYKYNDINQSDRDPIGHGELTGKPWFMGRLWLKLKGLDLSISSHYGEEEIRDIMGKLYSRSSKSINGDILLKNANAVVTVKGFYGENLDTFYGGIMQGYISDMNSVENVVSTGGWTELQIFPIRNWKMCIGGGFERILNDEPIDLMRTLNDWRYINIGYSPGDDLLFKLEGDYLKTHCHDQKSRDNFRIHFVSSYSFNLIVGHN